MSQTTHKDWLPLKTCDTLNGNNISQDLVSHERMFLPALKNYFLPEMTIHAFQITGVRSIVYYSRSSPAFEYLLALNANTYSPVNDIVFRLNYPQIHSTMKCTFCQ